MDYQVDFKDSFIEDLEGIIRTIAAENRSAAQKLGEEIIHASESLKYFPQRHPRVRQRLQLRRFVVAGNFKVFYRICPDTRVVQILRCWDGRRGIDPHTGP